ncbi:proline dehydrogenase family protein [candidate division KSB1 bacterium]|nr:proline dehydrogenase family protein [candidate division KSB1 bacterium]
MSWFNRIIVSILPWFPKQFVWIFSKRYIAGKTIEDAIQQSKVLNKLGCRVTLDVLGEDITTLQEAEEEKKECLRVLQAIHDSGIDGSLSVKLTSIGLIIDKETCYQHVRDIVQRAKELDNFVRIDMEDVTTTDDTLDIYRRLRKDFDNMGTVVQAYLKRTPEDVQALIDIGLSNLRLCKGIYDESPEVAFKDKDKIRDQFVEIVYMNLKSSSYSGIATHDKGVISRSLVMLEQQNIPKDQYEFQMLLGVTEKLRQQLVGDGHGMRVYVPYGVHWFGYCMRRMKENPMLVGHIIKNLFVRG